MIFRGQLTGLEAGDLIWYYRTVGTWKIFRNTDVSGDNRMYFEGADDGWYFYVNNWAAFESVCLFLAATHSLRPVFKSDPEQAVWVVNLRSLDQ